MTTFAAFFRASFVANQGLGVKKAVENDDIGTTLGRRADDLSTTGGRLIDDLLTTGGRQGDDRMTTHRRQWDGSGDGFRTTGRTSGRRRRSRPRMMRRPVIAVADPARGFEFVEDAGNHVRGGAEDEVAGHQFHRRPLGALAEADETLDGDVDAPVPDPPFDGLGDGDASPRRARRLVAFEAPVDADHNLIRAWVQARHSQGILFITALYVVGRRRGFNGSLDDTKDR